MYFINIKQLKQDIINRDFTEKDRFIYAFIYIVIYSILSELSIISCSVENPTELLTSDYIMDIGTVFITIIGTYFLYRVNGGNNGEDFLGRYFSITWVMGIRLLPLAFVPMIVNISIYSFIDRDTLDIILVFFYLLYSFLIYYFSYGHIVDVSKKVKDES